jgi:type I phosphodiesterase/nucleotide pyrophosphatase
VPGPRAGEAFAAGVDGAPGAPRRTLATLPDAVLGELDRARRGVVVLAVDGLSYPAAAAGWTGAQLAGLDSTFPSTSTTGWLTAVTGVGPEGHGVPGMVYRVPGRGTLVYAVTGRVLARGPADPQGDRRLVVPRRTVFERAAQVGVRCIALPREIGWLPGPWARALLRGAVPLRGPERSACASQAADPVRLAAAVADQVAPVLAEAPTGRTLLWVYVNLDDYIHQHGYDDAVLAAVARLGEHAERWYAQGWTVLAHSDHGQVACTPDPALALAWSGVDTREDCYLPSGGAGRVRWLYPRPERAEAVRDRLVAALGDSAEVLDTARLDALGLGGQGALTGRVGAVVVVARDGRFPVPDAGLGWEHGGLDEGERLVPLATWRP